MSSPSLFHASWDPEVHAGTGTASRAVWRWAPSESSCPNTPETETKVTSAQQLSGHTGEAVSSSSHSPRPHSNVGLLPALIPLWQEPPGPVWWKVWKRQNVTQNVSQFLATSRVFTIFSHYRTHNQNTIYTWFKNVICIRIKTTC